MTGIWLSVYDIPGHKNNQLNGINKNIIKRSKYSKERTKTDPDIT